MDIQILQLIEGAKQAEGLTVIIDVFRAFSLECYMFQQGAASICAVGSIEQALRLKREDPSHILVGERGGKKYPGCDFGNSPSQIAGTDLRGKTVIHTTGAGTQGIANAKNADEVITGSLVNAEAVAAYIREKNPPRVSIVAMGTAGRSEAEEDVLCADYIRSLLTGEAFPIEDRVKALRTGNGRHFFNPDTQEIFPEADYWMCTKYDTFPFIIRAHRENDDAAQMERLDAPFLHSIAVIRDMQV